MGDPNRGFPLMFQSPFQSLCWPPGPKRNSPTPREFGWAKPPFRVPGPLTFFPVSLPENAQKCVKKSVPNPPKKPFGPKNSVGHIRFPDQLNFLKELRSNSMEALEMENKWERIKNKGIGPRRPWIRITVLPMPFGQNHVGLTNFVAINLPKNLVNKFRCNKFHVIKRLLGVSRISFDKMILVAFDLCQASGIFIDIRRVEIMFLNHA